MDDEFERVCWHCGEPLAENAAFCRECGASDELGWGTSEGEIHGETAMEEEFDYDEYLRTEFPDQAPPKPLTLRAALFALVALLLIAALLMMTLL